MSPRAPIGASPPQGRPSDPELGGRSSAYDGDPRGLARSAQDIDHRAPHPLYCVWEITLSCDLGCKHCGSRAGKARQQELSTEQALDIVAQLRDLGVREVTLIGGEFYLRQDWPTLARAITDAGMICGMTTGARNLTQQRVDQAVAAGVRTISVSIDGLEQTHDVQRGAKGSFAAALAAARRVALSPMQLSVNTQINRMSLPELVALADMLVDLGAAAWQVQLAVPMGRGADRPQMLLQPYDLLELFPLLVWIKQHKLEPAGIQLFPGNNVGYFGPYEKLLRYGGERGAHFGGCAAGTWCLGLEADGKIKGCPSLPSADYTGGYLGQDRIVDALKTRQLRGLSERTRADLWGFCGDCYYADVCKAGCTWTSHCTLGRPGNNPYCIHRALQLERQGKRERLVKVADAPGRPFDHGRFELRVEPLAGAGDGQADDVDQATPSINGHDLKAVTQLRHDVRSAWSESELREFVQRS